MAVWLSKPYGRDGAGCRGHAFGQRLGGFEVVAVVNGANRLGVLIAHGDNPNRDFLAFAVLVGLGAVKENSAPLRRGHNRHGQRASCAQMAGYALGFFLGGGVHLGKFGVTHFAGVFAFAVIDGKCHIESFCSQPGFISEPVEWVFTHPPHLTQSTSAQKRDSRGTRLRGANEAKRSGSGGWRDSGNGKRPTQPAVGRGESGRKLSTRPQRSLIKRRKDLQELRRVALGVGP